MPKRLAGLTGRALWTLTAQSFSSGSNFLLTVLVLSTASVPEFATFSITVTTYLLVVQLSRALVSVPVMILHSGGQTATPSPDREDSDDRSAAAVVLVTGALACAALAIAALTTEPILAGAGEQFLVLAIATPALLLQDNARHIAFARGQPAVAAVSDAIWVGLQLLGSVTLFLSGRASTVGLMGVWAAAGALGWVAALLSLRARPLLSGARAWLGEHKGLCRRLVVEFAALSSSYYILYFGLAVVAGAEQLGRFKAAQTMFGPVIVVLLGGISLGVPESVRARNHAPHLRRIALLLSGGLAAASLVVGTALYALLPTFGPRWFPNAWETARPLIPLFALFSCALGASTGPISGLRALGSSHWIMRARVVGGVALVVAGVPASWAAGAAGALVALATVEAAVAGAAWIEFQRMVTRAAVPPPAPPEGDRLT